MKCPQCGHKFKDQARVAGGQRSKRVITPDQQASLQAARKAAREAKPELLGTSEQAVKSQPKRKS